MAKRTLLDMVQSIMSDMDSDEVTSITDTVESGQVASVLRDVYEQMVTDQIIPELVVLGQLSTMNLTLYPWALNYLEIPAGYSSVDVIKYDIHKAGALSPYYVDMNYLTPREFLNLVEINQENDNNVVQVVDPGGMDYWIRNNTAPRYFTSFDDHFIAFDAIDLGVDSPQLVGEKSRVTAKRIPSWTMDNTFIPDMDENLFPYLLAEAKSTCFVNLKQQANPKVDKQARDQRNRAQGNKFRTKAAQKRSTGNTGPNFGRN